MLIAFASWEDRCREGICREFDNGELGPVVLFYYDDYSERTVDVREAIDRECERRSIDFSSVMLELKQPAKTWLAIMKAMHISDEDSSSVTLNISTMPRNIIWSCLWSLDKAGIQPKYSYDRPVRYSDDWLSRDPCLPRLMFKMSGIFTLGRKTALLLLSGYDVEKVEYLIRVFEPSQTLIGFQSQGQADDQNDEHVAKVKERLASLNSVNFFEVDAYSEDCGQEAVADAIETLGEEYNIIASSLGPKLSAIALYRLQSINENVGLAYSTSKEYNPDYSFGLADKVSGVV